MTGLKVMDLPDESPDNECDTNMRPRLFSQQIQKKQREKELLAEFGALYADFPVGTLIESDKQPNSRNRGS
jgi:hypothetical protein